MTEFEIIAKYFARLTMGQSGPAGLQDDAAVLRIPDGQELIVTSDTLNVGTHFLKDAGAADIAHKALRVNLSDLAAMGADPFSYQLNIAFPEKPEEVWLSEFTEALLADQKAYDIFCSGGDTTSINGPLSISVTAMGLVPEGKAVKRSGAKPGDKILLSRPVGDAWIGLQILQGKLEIENPAPFIQAYKRPDPEIALAENLRDCAHAAIDISDGLAADLAHLCKASDCAAAVQLTPGMFSKRAQTLIKTGAAKTEDLLTGGDDYALLMAVPSNLTDKFKAIEIGEFTSGAPDVSITDENGRDVSIQKTGWRHF